MPDGRFSGKTVLVTGGGRGIGRAIAIRLASEGARVFVGATLSGDAALEAIRAVGGTGEAVLADLATLEGIDRFAAEFQHKSGIVAPDILINNAGVLMRGVVANVTTSEYERIFSLNVRAPFFLIQRFIPGFARGGRIINVSSRLSLLGPQGLVAYAMTKAAINAMTRGLANELGPSGVTVNAVGPGTVETDLNAERFAVPETRANIAAMAALKRTAKPDDIADVVAFLASEDARWITGAYIEAAGGAGL